MTAKHTSGPWTVANGLQVWKDGHNAVTSPRICTLRNASEPVDQIGTDEMEANAQLIAAAPELLEALQFIVNDAEPGEDAQLTTAGYNRACAAIRKALGESVPA
jgi:hypothetical protein